MSEWQPIETAPIAKPIIVSDDRKWTLARMIACEVQRLQLRWPPIKYETEWRWVYSPHGYQKIDFDPTHWMDLELTAPPSIKGKATP